MPSFVLLKQIQQQLSLSKNECGMHDVIIAEVHDADPEHYDLDLLHKKENVTIVFAHPLTLL